MLPLRKKVILKKVQGKWGEKVVLPKFSCPVWRVSWSLTGNLLAVATADNNVYVFEERSENVWEQISQIKEQSSESGFMEEKKGT